MNQQERRGLKRRPRGAADSIALQDVYETAKEQHATGLLAEAIAGYERILERIPAAHPRQADLSARLAHASYNLANAHARNGDMTTAVQGYDRAVRLVPGFAQAHGNLIRTLLALHDPAAGLAAVMSALRLAPTTEVKRLLIRCAGSVGGMQEPEV